MDSFDLLVDLHKHNLRQGPGSPDITEQAIDLTGLKGRENLEIVDIGCGTGGQTLSLASNLHGRITAVDLFPQFLEVLSKRAVEQGVNHLISTQVASMDKLTFEDQQFDLIWSEGAIYIMGFENGIRQWHRFLKTGGILAVSDITWTTDSRPAELEEFWKQECPDIDRASGRISVLEENGYGIKSHLILPEECWIEHYYLPLQQSYDSFLLRQGNSLEALELVDESRKEFDYYMKYRQYYSYGFYIAQKL